MYYILWCSVLNIGNDEPDTPPLERATDEVDARTEIPQSQFTPTTIAEPLVKLPSPDSAEVEQDAIKQEQNSDTVDGSSGALEVMFKANLHGRLQLGGDFVFLLYAF